MTDGFTCGIIDHIDIRVRDLAAAEAFYAPFCAAIGFTDIVRGERTLVYKSRGGRSAYLCLVAHVVFSGPGAKITFRVPSEQDVHRIAGIARSAGATNFSATTHAEHGPYSTAFADPDGNPYEICYRPLKRPIARLWRGRVRPGMIEEYRRYVAATGLSDYRKIPGNIAAYLLTGDAPTHGDVITLSLWDSLESISRFAGEDVSLARYYPEDEQFLLDFPKHVEHFDVTIPE